MATGRLFEILYYLIDKRQTTAKELAEHFEVSQRTIYRDLDKLLVAGIPVTMIQGKGGGIYLDENFAFDKTILDTQDQQQILWALKSLSSLHIEEYQNLLKRMQIIFQQESQDWLEVDFTSWHQDQEMNHRFDLLKKFIFKHQVMTFDYMNGQGQKSFREVYPVKIFFKGNSWYLQAYEKKKESYRTYKLSRMSFIKGKDEYFDKNQLPKQTPIAYQEETQDIDVILKFQKSLGSFVYDEFSYQDIQEMDDGYFVTTKICQHQWLLSFLLSFGSGVEVIEPISLRQQLKDEIEKIKKLYE